MKIIKRKGIYGKIVNLYIPETDADLDKIKAMDKAGLIDTAVGFADARNEIASELYRASVRAHPAKKRKVPQLVH